MPAEPHLPTFRLALSLEGVEAALRALSWAASHRTLQERVLVVNNDQRRVNQTCRWRCLLPVPSVKQSVNPPAASLERQFPHGLGLIHRVRRFEMPAHDGWTRRSRVRMHTLVVCRHVLRQVVSG